MKKTGIILLFLLTAIISQQCIKSVDYAAQEQKAIQDFLNTNDITVQPKESGLYYIEKVAGTGAQPMDSDTVSINYITYKLNGLVFDTNIEDVAKNHNIWNATVNYAPFTFVKGSGSVIKGVDEGVGYMKVGGKATLVIPSKLAYNDYQPLAFYIELLEVKHDTTAVR